MEDAYFIIAVVAFALAACSLIACIIIFFRAGVLDAIRFLQHRPVKKRPTGQSASKRRTHSQKKVAAPAKSAAKDQGAVAEGGSSDKSTTFVKPAAGEESENPTDLLGAEASENPTGLLEAEPSENPTGLLETEASENPTGLLGAEASENPTGLLETEGSENPTSLLSSVASENPTGLLSPEEGAPPKAESTKRAADEPSSGVAQQEETMFRFILKQNEVIVHTQETIA